MTGGPGCGCVTMLVLVGVTGLALLGVGLLYLMSPPNLQRNKLISEYNHAIALFQTSGALPRDANAVFFNGEQWVDLKYSTIDDGALHDSDPTIWTYTPSKMRTVFNLSSTKPPWTEVNGTFFMNVSLGRHEIHFQFNVSLLFSREKEQYTTYETCYAQEGYWNSLKNVCLFYYQLDQVCVAVDFEKLREGEVEYSGCYWNPETQSLTAASVARFSPYSKELDFTNRVALLRSTLDPTIFAAQLLHGNDVFPPVPLSVVLIGFSALAAGFILVVFAVCVSLTYAKQHDQDEDYFVYSYNTDPAVNGIGEGIGVVYSSPKADERAPLLQTPMFGTSVTTNLSHLSPRSFVGHSYDAMGPHSPSVTSKGILFTS